ncbi:MAG: hypothetical protein ACI8UO_004173 [Verrucomicrobiales bacterium]|jgi:hypothetical protein
MKHDSSTSEKKTTRALREWTVEVEPPPGFRRGIRQRINAAAANSGGFFGRLGETFARPLIALPTLIACLAVALALAQWQVDSAKRDVNDDLERLYAASIDPLDPDHLAQH